jgi:hypothetical protein
MLVGCTMRLVIAFNCVGTRLSMNRDRLVPLCIKGRVPMRAKMFFLNGTRTAI